MPKLVTQVTHFRPYAHTTTTVATTKEAKKLQYQAEETEFYEILCYYYGHLSGREGFFKGCIYIYVYVHVFVVEENRENILLSCYCVIKCYKEFLFL